MEVEKKPWQEYEQGRASMLQLTGTRIFERISFAVNECRVKRAATIQTATTRNQMESLGNPRRTDEILMVSGGISSKENHPAATNISTSTHDFVRPSCQSQEEAKALPGFDYVAPPKHRLRKQHLRPQNGK